MDAKDALVMLSALAADFKMGVVPDQYVEEIIMSIVDAMDLSDIDKLVLKVNALSCWGIPKDAWTVGDSE
jgi:hypothetical protein